MPPACGLRRDISDQRKEKRLSFLWFQIVPAETSPLPFRDQAPRVKRSTSSRISPMVKSRM